MAVDILKIEKQYGVILKQIFKSEQGENFLFITFGMKRSDSRGIEA